MLSGAFLEWYAGLKASDAEGRHSDRGDRDAKCPSQAQPCPRTPSPRPSPRGRGRVSFPIPHYSFPIPHWPLPGATQQPEGCCVRMSQVLRTLRTGQLLRTQHAARCCVAPEAGGNARDGSARPLVTPSPRPSPMGRGGQRRTMWSFHVDVLTFRRFDV
jgi:hypothetical protein